MCGILFEVMRPEPTTDEDRVDEDRATGATGPIVAFAERFARLRKRGPDHSRCVDETVVVGDQTRNVRYGFHRLIINGCDARSNQPFERAGVTLLCNGEIWNHEELRQRLLDEAGSKPPTLALACEGDGDCNVLLPYYLRYGMQRLLKDVDGVFSMVVYDRPRARVYVARDVVGIRSLYYRVGREGLSVASELQGVAAAPNRDPDADPDADPVRPFPPGHLLTFAVESHVESHVEGHTLEPFRAPFATRRARAVEDPDAPSYIEACAGVRRLLTAAVRKRFMTEAPFGCILSGGLDSSLVTGLVCKLLGESRAKTLHTFTIGMAGGSDFVHARAAADFLGTCHHEIVLSEDEFVGAIPSVVRAIESDDVTTVRASVGNYLVAREIRRRCPSLKVVFCGDVADELFGGYRGFGLADPKDDAGFHRENMRLMQDIHAFDVLRSEKCFAAHGLEARVPFGDRDLVDYVTTLPVAYKRWGPSMPADRRVEKHLLRAAFEDTHVLPESVLHRRKEAFSDGVSAVENSWHTIIQARAPVLRVVEPTRQRTSHPHDRPAFSAESAWYRDVFDAHFRPWGDAARHTIPYYWTQPFTTLHEPSARALTNYA